MSGIRSAVLPVGGLGTRLLPATKAVPKEMLTVVDRPLIQYAVDEARACGIERFIFVTGPEKHAIEDHFDPKPGLQETLHERRKEHEREAVAEAAMAPGEYVVVRQPEPLGDGHSVWCARTLLEDEPFAVLFPDDLILSDTPCLQQLLDVYEAKGGNVVAVQEVPASDVHLYGVVGVDDTDAPAMPVRAITEKPSRDEAPSTLAILGRFVVGPEVLSVLDQRQAGAGGEVRLTEALAETIGRVPLHAVPVAGQRFDCGKTLGFVEANLAFALRHPDLRQEMRDLLVRYREQIASD